MNLSPPRVRLEYAVLTFAARSSTEDAAVATVADACQAGRTTARRLVDALAGIRRIPRRRLLLTVLDDVASGAYSALERCYLTAVERPHGLSAGTRQRRVSPGRSIAYRDVEYVGLRTVVELDGRLGTRLLAIGGGMSLETSTVWSAGTARYGSAGNRSLTRAGSPSRSRDCCWLATGPGHLEPVAPPARSSSFTTKEDPRQPAPGILRCRE